MLHLESGVPEPTKAQLRAMGWTLGPQPNWAAVTNWQDTGWYEYFERENPGQLSSFSTIIRAEYLPNAFSISSSRLFCEYAPREKSTPFV